MSEYRGEEWVKERLREKYDENRKKENSMTLLSININEETENTLEQMCEAHGTNEAAIIRDAVRLYSYLELKVANGYRLQLIDADGGRRRDVELP